MAITGSRYAAFHRRGHHGAHHLQAAVTGGGLRPGTGRLPDCKNTSPRRPRFWRISCLTSWPSPPTQFPTGRISGPTTRWKGSIRRSAGAEPVPVGNVVGIFPNRGTTGAWWARCLPSSTTNGQKAGDISPSPTISTPRLYRPTTSWRQQPEPQQQG